MAIDAVILWIPRVYRRPEFREFTPPPVPAEVDVRRCDVDSGRVDICKGYGGVLVRPHFFGQAAFDIPDLLWTVDDIWLSGRLALAGVPIWKVANADDAVKTDLTDVDALVDYVYDDHRREQANVACIRNSHMVAVG